MYRVGLARRDDKPEVEAWVFDLPGCCTIGRSDDEVHTLLPFVIAEHLTWLAGHGIVGETTEPANFDVVETVTLHAAEEHCFAADRTPVDAQAIEDVIRRMESARRDLLRVVGPLPSAILDWRPPASSVSINAWEPEARTIREILNHVASTEGYYRRSLFEVEPEGETEAEQRDLSMQREKAVARLHELGARPEHAVFRPGWRSEPEEWTVRKALRRYIWHERFHTREIEQRLAWLVLGIPKVTM